MKPPNNPEPRYLILADECDNTPAELAGWGWFALVDPAVGGVVAYLHPDAAALLDPYVNVDSPTTPTR